MNFAQHFRIANPDTQIWFDPILYVDTRLFVDPFLIFDNEFAEFEGSHSEIVSFFEHIFKLVAKSGGRRRSHDWQIATALLSLKEVSELCLGYTVSGTEGAGSGRGLAEKMAAGVNAAIEIGLKNLDHFEEVQIFQEGIGPDRISDATAGILRHRFAAFTQRIAKEHGLPTKSVRFLRGVFDLQDKRWKAQSFSLPENPFTKKPIFLCPKAYLRPMPTINAEDFWDYCCEVHSDLLRNDLGYDILRRLDKKSIIDLARNHPDLREQYVKCKEFEGGQPYDLKADASGFYQPYIQGFGWAQNNSFLTAVKGPNGLFNAVLDITKQFRLFVEDRDGWRLLWNDDGSAKKEIAFQALYSGVVLPYCQANNIDCSKEANIGRGPVDFKFSRGYDARILLEAKLASNSRFWSGLTRQLPTYLKAEGVNDGIFLVACQRSKDFERFKDIDQEIKDLKKKTGFNIQAVLVDCQRAPLSASKLH